MTGPTDPGEARRRVAALRSRLRNPPSHWMLLGTCVLLLGAMITFQGFTTHTIGAGTEGPEDPQAGAPLKSSRPLLAARGDHLKSPQPDPGKRIALTFDDGPDPRWTPKILAVLQRERVPGTFFMVGSQAARHSDVVREVERAGHEIGNHTFTHAGMSSGPAWLRRAEVHLTEAILLGITGHYPRFIRPPYSATSDAVTPATDRALAKAAGRRYIIALADYDASDWEKPGVAKVVRNATPPAGRGGVIMFHDSGGDRRQTVEALARIIPKLRAQGYSFVPLRDMLGLTRAEAEPAAPWLERTRGTAFLWAVKLAFWLTRVLGWVIIAIGVLVIARVLVVLPLAVVQVRRARSRPSTRYQPSVAVIVPAYNEAVGIERAVRSLAQSDYSDLEVVVVDDGSTDGTGELVEALGLPAVRVLRRPNGGKAAALTTGVLATEAEVVVMVDGDTVFVRDTIANLVQPLADPAVGAVSGNTKVGNRGGLLGRWQHIEYVMGFNLDRRMYEVLQCTPTVPGAVGAFRRSVLIEVGCVSSDTLAEDTDLTLSIGRHGHRVIYTEYARAWTEAPSTLGGLWRQRYRWSFGTMQAVWKHKGAIVSHDRDSRRIGLRALPYMFLFQILLPLLAPLVDLFALYGLIFTDGTVVVAFWLGFNLLQFVIAVIAFRLDGESLRPLWALPLQQFVYRQLMYLVIIESTISALVGARASWKTIPRTGDMAPPALAPPPA
ncbi:MAG: bifunctional polysaccharide deacetylase/glycosyltransferase family 2 protein [Vicinamibacterales bacterium]|nr:bifunctional polysaccharide deacetylase/glycosyltransferase family 2 protein [Vicinamibacterales bacterium]